MATRVKKEGFDTRVKGRTLNEHALEEIISEYRSTRNPEKNGETKKAMREDGSLREPSKSTPVNVDLNALARLLSSQARNSLKIKWDGGDLVIKEGVEVTRISREGLVSSTSRWKSRSYKALMRALKRRERKLLH